MIIICLPIACQCRYCEHKLASPFRKMNAIQLTVYCIQWNKCEKKQNKLKTPFWYTMKKILQFREDCVNVF